MYTVAALKAMEPPKTSSEMTQFFTEVMTAVYNGPLESGEDRGELTFALRSLPWMYEYLQDEFLFLPDLYDSIVCQWPDILIDVVLSREQSAWFRSNNRSWKTEKGVAQFQAALRAARGLTKYYEIDAEVKPLERHGITATDVDELLEDGLFHKIMDKVMESYTDNNTMHLMKTYSWYFSTSPVHRTPSHFEAFMAQLKAHKYTMVAFYTEYFRPPHVNLDYLRSRLRKRIPALMSEIEALGVLALELVFEFGPDELSLMLKHCKDDDLWVTLKLYDSVEAEEAVEDAAQTPTKKRGRDDEDEDDVPEHVKRTKPL